MRCSITVSRYSCLVGLAALLIMLVHLLRLIVLIIMFDTVYIWQHVAGCVHASKYPAMLVLVRVGRFCNGVEREGETEREPCATVQARKGRIKTKDTKPCMNTCALSIGRTMLARYSYLTL